MRRIPLILFALAALLVVAAVVTGVSATIYAARAERATGTVVALDVRQSGGARSEVTAFPIVEFTPRGGRPVRFRGEAGGGRELRVGRRVPVLFLPDPPRKPRLAGAAAGYGLPSGLLFGALLVAGCGALVRRVVDDPIGRDDPDDPDDPDLDA